jgi:hypothetical protein
MMSPKKLKSVPETKTGRVLNTRPDTLDFRDKMYVPNLYEVPVRIDLDEYLAYQVPILDQGQEGACTGFGLATVANYLLRQRKTVPDPTPVSPRMFYEMAKRYDEWPGEDYSGSSARGAMKGWHKHGVCQSDCWPYDTKDESKEKLNETRTSDATRRPLGAYYRVNHQDLIAMHTALAEVGVLYATGSVHDGWSHINDDGVIIFSETVLGGHAFAIVAYDHRGFWIQNSWGDTWGKNGFALITYDDWLINGTDTWVARLGAPVDLNKPGSIAAGHAASAGKTSAYSFADLRPHIISIGNDGLLRTGGDFGTDEADVDTVFNTDFPRITKGWTKKRILLYAHGGLVSEGAAVQRLAEYRPALLEAEIYPISFIWKTDAWTTITNILQDAFQQRKPEGFLNSSKDFMLDRLDDALEPVARALTGKLQWDEMKRNALLATTSKAGGARFALHKLKELNDANAGELEIHIVGHSAGSIFMAPFINLLTSAGTITSSPLQGETGLGLTVKTCSMWAPACTVDLFKEHYLPAVISKTINRFTLFTLTDQAEQDDNCAHIYNKSLLYLVSDAFEAQPRIPFFRDGVPILGMQKFISKDIQLTALFKDENADWILSPNSAPGGTEYSSTSTSHGGFDDDINTVKATLARMLEETSVQTEIHFKTSASKLMNRRFQLVNQQRV